LFGILEHQRETAIVLGFTANALLGSFGWLTRSVFGTRFKLLSGLTTAVAYILGELIWTRDLLRPEWKLPQPTQTLEEMIETMSRSVAILQKYLGRES
jgi:formate-dependent nitrite reductase membrane component NrfD